MWLVSTEFANALQFVTVPLEFVGILLAIIELRFPALSKIASRHILNEGKSYLGPLSYKQIIQTSIGIGLGLVFTSIVGQSETAYALELLTFAISAIVCSYVVAAYWIPDRAIGSFGLCLAGFGLAGELFQLFINLATAPGA